MQCSVSRVDEHDGHALDILQDTPLLVPSAGMQWVSSPSMSLAGVSHRIVLRDAIHLLQQAHKSMMIAVHCQYRLPQAAALLLRCGVSTITLLVVQAKLSPRGHVHL
jgi:hypothetical protein